MIRVAGNIVAPSQVGSVEFAASASAPGWSWCSATPSAGPSWPRCEELRRPREDQSRNLLAIVDRVRPSVEALLATELRHDLDALVREAVRANIRASVDHLRHGSQILEQLIQEDGLRVVGAEYSLETGVVEFLEGVA